MSNRIIRDDISFVDKTGGSNKTRTLWARTKIVGGYGLYKDQFGVSQLNEVCFEQENMVPLGGVQYAMEMIFGVKGSIVIPTLNELYQIGALGSGITPAEGMPYAYGQKVCLFGIGVGGAASNNLTTLDVNYNEYDISEMIPFRYTNDALSDSDSLKYFGKKYVDDVQAYFLKRFDTDPVIKHCYKSGIDGEDGPEADDNVFTSVNNTGIESFTETCLTITKKDVREWFIHNGNIEEARVNSIGLFTAVYDEQLQDYANIRLFSKLNIPTEPLSLTKDMNIIYRVYGA